MSSRVSSAVQSYSDINWFNSSLINRTAFKREERLYLPCTPPRREKWWEFTVFQHFWDSLYVSLQLGFPHLRNDELWWIFLFLCMQAWPPRCTPNVMSCFGISTWDPIIYPVSPTPPYPTSLLVSTFPFCLLSSSPGLLIVTWMSDRDSIASARIAKYPL